LRVRPYRGAASNLSRRLARRILRRARRVASAAGSNLAAIVRLAPRQAEMVAAALKGNDLCEAAAWPGTTSSAAATTAARRLLLRTRGHMRGGDAATYNNSTRALLRHPFRL
jgi:hypothetical protein